MKFTVVDAQKNPICIIEAEDHARAQEFLKFNTPGSTFNLKVIAYNGREAPTHADWVNATLARIEKKHPGEPHPPFRYVVINEKHEDVCYIDAVNVKRAEEIFSSSSVPRHGLGISRTDRHTKAPSFADWVKLVTTPAPPRATQGEAAEPAVPVSPETPRFAWGQQVWVDADTENKRPGIIAWDQPSVTDQSWFVAMPGGVLQWTRAGRLSKREEAAEVKVVEKIVEVPRQAWRLPEPGDVVRIPGAENPHLQDDLLLLSYDPGVVNKYMVSTDKNVVYMAPQVELVRLHDAPPTADPSLGGHAAASQDQEPVIESLEARLNDLSGIADRLADNRARCRSMTSELKEAARYVHSCPDHVLSTIKTIAFRLDCLARGVEPEASDG